MAELKIRVLFNLGVTLVVLLMLSGLYRGYKNRIKNLSAQGDANG